MGRVALITGITGQDGSYLAELLLAKGYSVCGLVRRHSTPNTERIAHIIKDIELIQGDLLDQTSLIEVVQHVRPDEVYNLAAQSHVGLSFKQPIATMLTTGMGAIYLLEALRLTASDASFYQASTSELFGNATQVPQSEKTPFAPRSPYATAKLAAHTATINYREAYGMYACAGILFNHESPRRSLDFVTRKITRAVARIKAGMQHTLELGNLDAYRDWGYAGDYVEAMWLMLQQPFPKEYVIATGQEHTVREFVEQAFACLGLDWQDHVKINPDLFRPSEVPYLVGDTTKASLELQWKPRATFSELVHMMVMEDYCAIGGKKFPVEMRKIGA